MSGKVDTGTAGCIDLHRCSSTDPLVDLQRMLMSILGMLRTLEVNVSISLLLEMGVQWAAIAKSGPIGLVSWADLDDVAVLSGQAFADAVLSLHAEMEKFSHKVVAQ